MSPDRDDENLALVNERPAADEHAEPTVASDPGTEATAPDLPEGDASAGGAADAGKRPAGFYLTPRQAFVLIAGVLSVILVALVLYLLWLSRPADFTEEGGTPQSGIIPELAIYGPGTGEKPRFGRPMGSAWSPDGSRIYVADTQNNRVVVFDKDGKYLDEFGGFGIAKPLPGSQRTWDPGELNYPTDVATDKRGNVYVADFYNDSISVFDSRGKFLRRFPDPYQQVGKGSSGQEGGGISVTALTVAGGQVYATDEFQIFVFTTDGTYVRQFGKPGSGPGDLDRPGGVAVDSRGRVYVSDSNHNRVICFSPEGKPVWVTGRKVTELMKETENPFILPRGITILQDGSLLVADPLGQQLVKLGEDGKVIATYGTRGTLEGQLNFPNDVASVDDRIVIADRENDRAQVVRLTER